MSGAGAEALADPAAVREPRHRLAGLRGSIMRRRDFLAAIGATAACSPPSRAAQRGDPVIGYLYAGSLANNPDSVEAFWKGLAELGYVQGRNVRAEYREAKNDLSRLADLVRDLVRREVSVIAVPGSGPAARAAMAATTTIPIVFDNAGDPLQSGLVTSLSRPGGNVTGITDFGNDLSAKRLELIKQLAPAVSRIGILLTRNYTSITREIAVARQSAPALSLETTVSVVGDQQEIDAAFAEFARAGVDGLYVAPSPLFVAQRAHIVALAARHRLPAVYPFILYPQAGGLMSYGTSLVERSYQAGVYAGLILNGAKPAELPVRRLSRFELVVNMSTARALGLTVPARFLALTDEVIE
jgi:putative ABC transport system substrate-binding protein